jgi:hypothetical protein
MKLFIFIFYILFFIFFWIGFHIPGNGQIFFSKNIFSMFQLIFHAGNLVHTTHFSNQLELLVGVISVVGVGDCGNLSSMRQPNYSKVSETTSFPIYYYLLFTILISERKEKHTC